MEKLEKANIDILVVDDEMGMRDMLSYELNQQGFRVSTAADGQEAVEMVRQKKYDLVISDIKMPKMDGVTALEEIKKLRPEIEVILATGFGTIETAVNAMKKGAYDFIQKPYNLDEVSMLIEKALEKGELKALVALYESSKVLFSTVKLSDLFKIVMDLIQKVLRADEGSVMLLGEDEKLRIAASVGLDEEVASKVCLSIGERVAGRAISEKREFLLLNNLNDYPEFQGIDSNSRISSSIVIPLTFQDGFLGVLNINRLKGTENFNAADLRNASIFASQVSQAVRNGKLYEELENKIGELKAAYKMLEETKDHLVESEKLASIGKLVAGVAHELNNPLTSVIGYTDLLIHSDIDGEAKEQLMIVFKEAERCRRIIQDLLVFARRRQPVAEEVSLGALIDETIQSLFLEFEKNKIKIVKNFPSHPTITADACQLKQVFMNILKNAVHALEKTPDKKIEIGITSDKNFIHTVLSDNGSGITKENLSKIFDPFFSTKEVGSGTGLGLSLSHSILKQHGGKLSVQSELGKGATFNIELPLKSTLVIAPTVVNEDLKAVDLTGKSILIAEDEVAIRNFLSHALKVYGCEIVTVENGPDALAQLERRDFDLILSDFRMPGMDGIQLYEKIKILKPNQAKHFVFMTGDPDKKLRDFFETNPILFIMKPFRPNDLVQLLKKAFQTESVKK